MWIREGTQDGLAYKEVILDNEYRLPDKFAHTDVIVDIGAHIGCFAIACLLRGAGRVACYEPDPDNFDMLRRNLGPYADKVELHNAAVWRSDVDQNLFLTQRDPALTAMSHTLYTDGKPVESVRFDTVMKTYPACRLVKLDCEGAEFPILFTSKELGGVKEIVGEAHLKMLALNTPYEQTSEALVKRLRELGFVAKWIPHHRDPDLLSFFWGAKP